MITQYVYLQILYTNVMMAEISHLKKNFKGMNSVQVYIGLFRNKACNMHINVGGREACQQWCQTVSS